MLIYINIFTVASYISKIPTERRRKFGKTSELMEGLCFLILMGVCRRHNTRKDSVMVIVCFSKDMYKAAIQKRKSLFTYISIQYCKR
jgi:hypothetical protein